MLGHLQKAVSQTLKKVPRGGGGASLRYVQSVAHSLHTAAHIQSICSICSITLQSLPLHIPHRTAMLLIWDTQHTVPVS